MNNFLFYKASVEAMVCLEGDEIKLILQSLLADVAPQEYGGATRSTYLMIHDQITHIRAKYEARKAAQAERDSSRAAAFAAVPVEYADAFLAFWRGWLQGPKHDSGGKKPAFGVWTEQGLDATEEMLAGVAAWKQFWLDNEVDPKWIPSAKTFLAREQWRVEPSFAYQYNPYAAAQAPEQLSMDETDGGSATAETASAAHGDTLRASDATAEQFIELQRQRGGSAAPPRPTTDTTEGGMLNGQPDYIRPTAAPPDSGGAAGAERRISPYRLVY